MTVKIKTSSRPISNMDILKSMANNQIKVVASPVLVLYTFGALGVDFSFCIDIYNNNNMFCLNACCASEVYAFVTGGFSLMEHFARARNRSRENKSTDIFQTIPSSDSVIGFVSLSLSLLSFVWQLFAGAPALYDIPSLLPVKEVLALPSMPTLLLEDDCNGCSLGGIQSAHPMDAINHDIDANIAQ
mmetsp:Transcript_15514/g.21593  ORF Transcript_15514/g.21593 Transcript_15514/m.21593 type:complete len:187 (-) Transcript_15514:120-680(-)